MGSSALTKIVSGSLGNADLDSINIQSNGFGGNGLSFIFPGQGSQKVGMLGVVASKFSVVQRTFDEASDVLGYQLWDLVQYGDQQELNMTEKTQPMLLASSIALWRVWIELGGVIPSVMAGHSLGEFSALVAADVLSFQDAIRLVRLRGKYMQSAVPKGEGGMAAIIGLDDSTVTQVCRDACFEEVVAPVNFNAPGQVVIAGSEAAVERAIALCKEAGAKRVLPLPVSAPFHTVLMKPAAEQLESIIEDTVFQSPSIPVIHNVHARTEDDPRKIKELMVEQICQPVQWVSCMQEIVARGAFVAVECGPGKVLCGLSRRIDKALKSVSIEDPDVLQKTVEEFKIVFNG